MQQVEGGHQLSSCDEGWVSSEVETLGLVCGPGHPLLLLLLNALVTLLLLLLHVPVQRQRHCLGQQDGYCGV